MKLNKNITKKLSSKDGIQDILNAFREFIKEWAIFTDDPREQEYQKMLSDWLSTTLTEFERERLENLQSWIHKEANKSARAGVLGYDFVHRLEGKLREDIFELEKEKRT